MRLNLGPINFRASLADKSTQFQVSDFPCILILLHSVFF